LRLWQYLVLPWSILGSGVFLGATLRHYQYLVLPWSTFLHQQYLFKFGTFET
jgi:hypothetical protein